MSRFSRIDRCLLIRITGIAAFIALWVPFDAVGQEDCRSRCIIVDEHLRLGAVEDPASISAMPFVRWIGDRYWVTDAFLLTSSILHYDANGRFVGEIGRSGQGPGEFQWVNKATPWPGDSALVSEVDSRAHVVAPDGTARWLGNIPTASGLKRLASGVLVTAGRINRVEEAIGYPLHSFDPNGVYRGSFGLDRPHPAAHDVALGNFALGRSIAISGRGGFWAVGSGRSTAERWSGGGELLQVVELSPEWFPERTQPDPNWDIAPPSPGVVAVQERGQHLWFLMWIADRDWAPQRQGEPSRRSATASNFRVVMDGLIVVVDIENGDVVATARLDEPLFGFANDGLAYSMREDPTGLVQLVLWKLDLVDAR